MAAIARSIAAANSSDCLASRTEFLTKERNIIGSADDISEEKVIRALVLFDKAAKLSTMITDVFSGNFRNRVTGSLTFLAATNIGIWLWAFLAFHDKLLLLGTALLAYTFGLRHAVDADHIAAIDNVTRKLVQEGQRPVLVGFFFSLGHSTVVFLASMIVYVTASAFQKQIAGVKEFGGMVGTSISAFFLISIAVINMVILRDVWTTFQNVCKGKQDTVLKSDIRLSGGLLARIFGPLFRMLSSPWQMYPIGLMFGLGFDTATQVALLGISAAATANGLSLGTMVIFPALFTAGMTLVDTTDGILMVGAYGWAFVKPIRKLYYNLTVTFVSVLVALLIGGIEAVRLLSDRLNLRGGVWDLVRNLNDNLGTLGFAIIGLFLVSWIGSAMIYRIRGFDRIESAEEALRRSEAYLAEAQKLSHTGSFGWNVAAGKVYWSQETFRIFECDTQKEPTLSLILHRTHPEDRVLVQQMLARVARQREGFDFEQRLLMPNGAVKYLRVVGRPGQAESEGVEFVGAITDITEGKRAEARLHRKEVSLREAQTELAYVSRITTMGELTASIAHEVNQPLASIVANAYAGLRWLAGESPNFREVRDAIGCIVRDGKRAADVIARMRALFQRTRSAMERLDINEAIEEVVMLTQSEVRRNKVTSRMELAPDLPAVMGDRVQLQQVVMNLILNAIQAMSTVEDRQRELVIATQSGKGDEVRVIVQDSGIGFDPADSERMFQAFHTTKSGGLGVGLSISRSIVESHGGRLWAVSNDSHGATLQFTLLKCVGDRSLENG